VKNIPVGEGPADIYGDARDMIYDMIYVANSDSNTISVINTTTNTVEHDITVGEGPADINGYSTDVIYVANSDTVSVINTTTNTVEHDIPLEGGAAFIYSDGDPDSDIIYVANSGSNTVSVIDKTTNTVKQTIPVGKIQRMYMVHWMPYTLPILNLVELQ
jgi:YVTN family beta-propeller protein